MEYLNFYELAYIFLPAGLFLTINLLIRYLYMDQDSDAKLILYFSCNMAVICLCCLGGLAIFSTLLFFIVLTTYVSFKRCGKNNEIVDFFKDVFAEKPQQKEIQYDI